MYEKHYFGPEDDEDEEEDDDCEDDDDDAEVADERVHEKQRVDHRSDEYLAPQQPYYLHRRPL